MLRTYVSAFKLNDLHDVNCFGFCAHSFPCQSVSPSVRPSVRPTICTTTTTVTILYVRFFFYYAQCRAIMFRVSIFGSI